MEYYCDWVYDCLDPVPHWTYGYCDDYSSSEGCAYTLDQARKNIESEIFNLKQILKIIENKQKMGCK